MSCTCSFARRLILNSDAVDIKVVVKERIAATIWRNRIAIIKIIVRICSGPQCERTNTSHVVGSTATLKQQLITVNAFVHAGQQF